MILNSNHNCLNITSEGNVCSLLCKQGVRSSNLLISTTKCLMQLHKALFFVSLKLQLTDIMLKKLLISLLALVLFPSFLMAQQDFRRHEFRLGMGDMGFEKAAFHNSRQQVGYRYFGHLFAGYRYSFNDWLGAGADVDFSNVSWESSADRSNHDFQNISIIPSVRFTYFRKGIVSMYSGLGIGLNINTGTEIDYLGRKTVCAPTFNPVFYAISLAYKNAFGTLELGPLVSLNNRFEIFMLGSRAISISIGYRL